MVGRAASALFLLVGTLGVLVSCERSQVRAARELLVRARDALQTLPFQGIVRVQGPVEPERPPEVRYKVTVNPPEEPRIERLDPSPAPPKAPNGPRRRPPSRRGRIPVPSLDRIDLLLKNYAPSLPGEELVAGRSTRVMALSPRHPDRPEVKLWLDGETGLPLRTEERWLSGLSEIVLFEEFSPGKASQSAPVEASKVAPPPRREPVTVEVARSRLPFPPVQPATLPAGFELVGTWILKPEGRRPGGPGPGPGGPAPAPGAPGAAQVPPAPAAPPRPGRLQLEYSDGWTRITVFESSADEPESPPRERPGARPRKVEPEQQVAAGSLVVKKRDLGPVRMFHFTLGGTRVAVFGKLPERELLLMIETAQAR